MEFLLGGQVEYHTSDGATWSLPTIDSLVCIKLAAPATMFTAISLAGRRAEISDDFPPVQVSRDFYVFCVSNAYRLDSGLLDLESDSDVLMINPVIAGKDGSPVFAADLLFLRLESSGSPAQETVLHDEFAQFVNPPDLTTPDYRYVRIKPIRGSNVFDIASAYYESGICLCAKPDLIWSPLRNTVDLFPEQWHFKNTGQYQGTTDADIDADLAWLLGLGRPSVGLAILDSGFDWDTINGNLSHEDVDPITQVFGVDIVGESPGQPEMDYAPGSGCQSQLPCPCAHGTEVMGVLMPSHANLGLKGLAPFCTYYLIKGEGDVGGTSDSLFAAALRYVRLSTEAVILTFSIAPNYEGPDEVTSGELASLVADGIVVVGASGNEPDSVIYPVNVPGVIAVGATDQDDIKWSYSPIDDRIDFVAPAGLDRRTCPDSSGDFWTWDVTGADGFAPSNSYPACSPVVGADYHCRAGGTSIAAPQVAGVAALILSRRDDYVASGHAPDSVYKVLRYTADSLGPDSLYGWGRINAFRAVVAVSRGDFNADGVHNVQDVVGIINEVFRGGASPAVHPKLTDLNCDGIKNVQDVVQMVNVAFRGDSKPNACFDF